MSAWLTMFLGHFGGKIPPLYFQLHSRIMAIAKLRKYVKIIKLHSPYQKFNDKKHSINPLQWWEEELGAPGDKFLVELWSLAIRPLSHRITLSVFQVNLVRKPVRIYRQDDANKGIRLHPPTPQRANVWKKKYNIAIAILRHVSFNYKDLNKPDQRNLD